MQHPMSHSENQLCLVHFGVHGIISHQEVVDVSYTTPQAHGIVNVEIHREYSPGIVFIFSQGRKDLYHV
jgi:hypothetical protein